MNNNNEEILKHLYRYSADETDILVSENSELEITFPIRPSGAIKIICNSNQNNFIKMFYKPSLPYSSNEKPEEKTIKFYSASNNRLGVKFNSLNNMHVNQMDNIELSVSNRETIISDCITLNNTKILGEISLINREIYLNNSSFGKLRFDRLINNNYLDIIKAKRCKFGELEINLDSVAKKIHFLECSFLDAPKIICNHKELVPCDDFSFFKAKFDIKNKSLTTSNNFRRISEIFKKTGSNMEFIRFQAYEQKYRPQETITEAINSFLYSCFNNYGLSLFKPLGWLIGSFFFFALVYCCVWINSFYQSMQISLLNILLFMRWLPFGKTSDKYENIESFSFVLLCSFQSILSFILLYLFIVGVRIRFKIRN